MRNEPASGVLYTPILLYWPPLIVNYRGNLDTFCSCEANDRLPFPLITTGGEVRESSTYMYVWLYVCMYVRTLYCVLRGEPRRRRTRSGQHTHTYIHTYNQTPVFAVKSESLISCGGPSVCQICQILCWSVHNPNLEGLLFFAVPVASTHKCAGIIARAGSHRSGLAVWLSMIVEVKRTLLTYVFFRRGSWRIAGPIIRPWSLVQSRCVASPNTEFLRR